MKCDYTFAYSLLYILLFNIYIYIYNLFKYTQNNPSLKFTCWYAAAVVLQPFNVLSHDTFFLKISTITDDDQLFFGACYADVESLCVVQESNVVFIV